MPKLPQDFFKQNFEGSSSVFEEFKHNLTLSILGLPFLALDTALLPLRAISSREKTRSDDERELRRLR